MRQKLSKYRVSENHESALDKIITHYVLRKNTFQLILEDELDLYSNKKSCIRKELVVGVELYIYVHTSVTSRRKNLAQKPIANGNGTEWSPIRPVIILVINKIGRPRSGSPICLITRMITDRIGRHKVLLPINHDFNKICDILGSFFESKHKKFQDLF